MSEERPAQVQRSVTTFARKRSPPGGVRFLPGGRIVAVTGCERIELWNAGSAAKVRQIRLPSGIRYGSVWAPAPRRGSFLCAGKDHDLRLVSELDGRELLRLALPAGARAYLGAELPGLICIHDVRNPDGSWEDRSVRLPPYRTACSAAFSPDGMALVAAYGQAYVLVWDLRTGKLRQCIGHDATPGAPARIYRVAWSPDGRTILTSESTRRLRVWDAASGRQVLCVQLRDDSRSGAIDRPVDMPAELWSLAGLGAIAFTPDSRHFVAGDGIVVRQWELRTGREVATWAGHGARHPIFGDRLAAPGILDIRFAADGRRALTVGQDATLRVWDVESGREAWSMTPDFCCVEWGDISPDGRCVVWAGCQGMRLYRVT